MIKKKTKTPKPIIVYDNNYMEALYQTDYLAKKIMIAASLRCREMDWEPNGCEIAISANELRELSGLTKNSLKHIENAVDKLHRTVIRLRDPKNDKNWMSFSFLPKGKYENGTLSLLINPEMKPLISNLQSNFTQYHIENIRPLKSGYSIRIFELLKMSAFKGRYKVTIDKLRKMFGLEDKYKNYNDLKKNVILPAYRELKEFCDIYFEYREIKKGRKVNEIEFEIIEQRKEFSDYEDVLGVEIEKIELKECVLEKSELEFKLNELGWFGDFEELTTNVNVEAVEHYYDTLNREITNLETAKIDKKQLHDYIDGCIKSQAQKSYDIFNEAMKMPDLRNKRINLKEYSVVAKELIKLGFIGDVESYIENEGRGLVKEALEAFKKESPKNIKNKIGLLREKIKALKIKKEIEKIDLEEEKAYGENIFLGKLEKYKDFNSNFIEDYKRFLDTPGNSDPADKKILQKYLDVSLEKIPFHILKEFIEWRA